MCFGSDKDVLLYITNHQLSGAFFIVLHFMYFLKKLGAVSNFRSLGLSVKELFPCGPLSFKENSCRF